MDLAYAVEANMADWVLAKASCSNDVELHLDGDASWTFTHAAAPDNTVVQARFSEGNVGVRVAEILDYHRQYKVACDWITGPMSQPASLGAVLRRAGFKCMIHCAGMVCDLRLAAERVPTPRGVEITAEDRWPTFERLTTERRRRAQSMRDNLVARRPQCAWHFAAALDGTVVGRTTLFIGPDVAGIYDVEVLKHARYRGIGTALVHAALRCAISDGHQYAVLAASGAGFGVYQRLGFQEVTRISFWRYGKMRQA